MSFLPSGVATLLTDLGLEDASVGIMKGSMLSRFAQIRIVDVCHFVPRQDVFWAAGALAGSYKSFPPGSVHCAVVCAGGIQHDDILVAEKGGHVFVALDNGVLTRVLQDGGRLWRVDLDRVPVATMHRTFHVRETIAPLGALLASGKLAPAACGELTTSWNQLQTWPTRKQGDVLEGVVVGQDRFGNLFTNITEDEVPADAGRLVVELGGRSVKIVDAYTQVESGAALALFNIVGMLEIAVRDAKASESFAWERGTPVVVRSA